MTPSAASFVDPFIGVDGAGNCLCGPYLPGSMVRLGPDTLPPQPTNGYRSNRPITCFSHTHVSGTGGGGRYGNIGVTPFVGLLRFSLDASQRENEQAKAGWYAVTLASCGVRAELTVTPRVGVHRYRFPAGSKAGILLDAGSVIQVRSGDKKAPGAGSGASIGGYVEWLSETEVVGRGDYRGGWGHDFPYAIYFYARFDRPALARSVANHLGTHAGSSADGANCKAAAIFGEVDEVNLHVGISFTSVAKARASVEREVGGRNFDAVRAEATETWDAALSRIRVTGGSEAQRTLFYTLFTRLLCMPSDLGVDDEFPSWHSGVRQFSDFYALWDSVRNANSLISLFDPELEVAMLNCLLDVADHIGWLPDAWIASHSAQIQGGSSADILFCEAALKGLPGIDYEKALRQMRKNNEVESPDPWLYGRHLKDYRDLGYLSTNVRKNCVSRTMEYAYQDWCIGTLAARLGHEEVAADYLRGSEKIWNLWRQDICQFAPKQPDGSWVEPFDPASALPDSWNDPYFYEGTSWQWSFNVQHDFAGLIARHGGPERFVSHLDRFFDEGHYDSKETMLHVPWLYIHAGRPDRTAERVRACMEKYFHTGRNGLRDNEDMGCQSAFYMCAALGIYPIMGQDLYWLSTPVFTRSEIQLGKSGKVLVIEAPDAASQKLYVDSATLNEMPLDRAWLRHEEIAGGAVVRFQLSSEPGAWGRDNPPPSPSSGAGYSRQAAARACAEK